MTLYEINNRIIEVWQEAVDPDTGEIISDDAILRINELELAKDEKIEGCALYIKNLMAEAKAVKEEKDKLASRQKALENKAEKITEYISKYLGGEKFSTPRVNISWRKSQAVDILDLSKIPDTFLKYSDPKPDKAAIKALLKAGGKVEGALLVENNNMTIK